MLAVPQESRQGELPKYVRGTAGFLRVSLAMFSAGLATFTTLYCAQALLPALAAQYRLSPATASLTVSVATAGLAIGVIPLTALSEAIGRTPMMTASVRLSFVTTIQRPYAKSPMERGFGCCFSPRRCSITKKSTPSIVGAVSSHSGSAAGIAR